jgi:hypothetical protein
MGNFVGGIGDRVVLERVTGKGVHLGVNTARVGAYATRPGWARVTQLVLTLVFRVTRSWLPGSTAAEGYDAAVYADHFSGHSGGFGGQE